MKVQQMPWFLTVDVTMRTPFVPRDEENLPAALENEDAIKPVCVYQE